MKITDPSQVTEPETVPVDPSEAAHQAVQAEAKALDPKKLAPFSLDVQYAVSVVLAKQPLLRTLRPELVLLAEAPKPGVDLAAIDKLECYALALRYSHARCLATSAPAADVATLRAEAIALRTMLRSDAQSFVNHGVIDASVLENLSGSLADLDIAGDLMALFVAFRAKQEQVVSGGLLTAAQLARASSLSAELLVAVQLHNAPRSETALELADDRRRIATLLLHAYNEAQQAVRYLRWHHHDAEQYVPSLYAYHPAGHGKATAVPAGEPEKPKA